MRQIISPLSLCWLVLCSVLSLPAMAQDAVSDRFDRANSTNLGLDWTEANGDGQIANGALQGNSPFSLSWAVHNTFNAPYAETVIRADFAMNGGGGDRVSLIAGADVNFGGIEIRIADNNGDTLADRIFFNAAINAGNWFGGSTFSDLLIPVGSGQATMWFTNAGDTVNIEIRNNAMGTVEAFSRSGVLMGPPPSTTFAIGYFNNSRIDNVRAWRGSPTTPVYTTNPLRANGDGLLYITDCAPNGAVLLAYSTVGNTPFATAIGNVFLSGPIQVLATLPTDATGTATLPLGTLAPSATGLTLWNQALDLVTPALSNDFSLTIL